MDLPNATVTYKSPEHWKHITGINRNYQILTNTTNTEKHKMAMT